MKMNELYRLIVILIGISLFSKVNAQEGGTGSCNDGIDNDNDGFIDCYDKECSSSSDCDDFFMNNNALCQVKPTQFPKFMVQRLWGSVNTSTDQAKTSNHSTIYVGDILNNDQIPEVIAFNSDENRMFIINGQTGERIASENITLDWQEFAAIGKINSSDDCGWIWVTQGSKIVAFDCNLNKQWESGAGGIGACHDVTGALGLADFNNDGRAELYYKNEIRDAETGSIIVSGSGNWSNEINAGPVAVNMDNSDPTLELVIALKVYKVDLATGTLSLYQEPPAGEPDYHIKNSFGSQNHNFTSVADYDLDGHLDVIANGANDTGDAAVFYWNINKGYVRRFDVPNAGTDAPNGTGRVNVANIDNIPGLNCTFAVKNYLFGLDENFKEKWKTPILEVSSGNTGTTVFDFNGDGESEIIYRDEEALYLIDGTDGSKTYLFSCPSQTGREYPVAADVNGDGETEICVSCQIGNTKGDRGNGEIRLYGSLNEKWMPARSIWNQHGYFNVNINEDMTIPKGQQLHHLSFSDYLCDSLDAGGNPVAGKVMPLNSFLNQSPVLESTGCPSYASPDLFFDGSTLQVFPPTCPEDEFYVSFEIENIGDIYVSKTLYVSFYEGDPTLPGSTALNTDSVEVVNLKPGESIMVDSLTVVSNNPDFDLFIVVNDPANILECDYSNNMASAPIKSLPFSITASVLSDNDKCYDSIPDNGQAKAFVWDGTNEITTGYTFRWFEDDGSTLTQVSSDALFLNMADGNYQVTAKHDARNCGSDTVSVTIDLIRTEIDSINIIQTQIHDDCLIPNGELKAQVWMDDGSGNYYNTTLDTIYKYNWWQGTQIYAGSTLSVDSIAQGLDPYTYIVLVENPYNGCSNTQTGTVKSNAKFPSIDSIAAKSVTSCKSENGELTAHPDTTEAVLNFEWFNGAIVDPVQKRPESVKKLENLGMGDYTLRVQFKDNGCFSAPLTESIGDGTEVPVFSLQQDAPQTSCDPDNPNGALSINASYIPSGATITWYYYDISNVKQVLAAFNGLSTATGLAAEKYFVEIKKGDCATLDSLTLQELIQKPDASLINITTTDVTNCDTSSANGSIMADYNTQTIGYTFYWFAESKFTDTLFVGNNFVNINPGTYSVKVMDNATFCLSNPVSDDVDLNTVIPNLVTSNVSPSFACDISVSNGSLLANASTPTGPEPSTGYFFEIFEGANTLLANRMDSIHNQDGATGYQPSMLAGNQLYRVKVTNEETQCSTFLDEFIDETTIQAIIDIGDFSITANTNCTAPGNGIVDATLAVSMPAPAPEPTSGYTFNWFDSKGTALSETGPVLSGIMDGVYELSVTNNDTKCTSDPVQITVGKNITYPSAAVSVAQPQTACSGSPNGAILANATTAGGEPASGYDFTWYQGSDFLITADQASAVAAPASHTANGLSKGTYTLVLENLDTRCSDTTDIFLNEQLVYPEIDKTVAIITDDGFCTDPGNGTIDASTAPYMPAPASEPIGGYDYAWYDDGGVLVNNNAKAEGLSGNENYQLIVKNNDTQCESQPASFLVPENHVLPVIQINILNNQISCSNNKADHLGELEALVDEGGTLTTANHHFEWFEGQTFTTNVSNSSTAGGLTDMTYTVRVTSDSTGCANTAEEVVPETLTYPVASVTPHDVTTCDPLDGEVNADVGGVVAGYTFYWYEGDSEKLIEDYTGASWTGLAPGEYTVKVFDNHTMCYSEDLTTELVGTTVNIDFNEIGKVIPGDCNLNSGEYTIEVTGGSSEFDFNWYKNDTPVPPTNIFAIDPDKIELGFDLEYGNYKIVVQDINTKCIDSTEFFLPYKNIHKVDSSVVFPNKVDATLCKAPYGGAIPTDVIIDPVAIGTGSIRDDYDFYIFEGKHNVGDGKAPLELPIPGSSIVPPGDSILHLDLEAGLYTISIIERATGCESQPVEVEILQDVDNPKITFNGTDDYSCYLPNGTMTTITNPAGPHTFEWYTEDPDGGASPYHIDNLGNDQSFVDTLAQGSYFVKVTSDITGCDTTAEFNIQKKLRNLTIDGTSVTTNTYCAPEANGAIAVGNVLENSIDESATFSYSNELYLASDLSTPLGSFNNLFEGDYIVVAINDSTLCEAKATVTVDKITFNPLPLATITNDPYCNNPGDPLFGNGALEAAVDEGGTATLTNYNFTWYAGNDTISGSELGPTYSLNEQAFDLASGSYTVKIIDLDGINKNCRSKKTFTVIEENPTISLSATPSDQTDCTNDNGSILVSDMQIDGSSVGLGSYNYIELFDDAKNTILSIGSPPNEFTGLSEGTYYLQIQDQTTMCISGYRAVEVEKNVPEPFISFAQQKDWSCDPNYGNGELTATVTINSLNVNGNYYFEWTDDLGNIVGANAIAGGLADGNYHLTITGSTTPGLGCVTQKSTTLLEDLNSIHISNHSVKDQDICLPNGEIAVLEVKENNLVDPGATYSYRLFDQNLNPIANAGSGTDLDPFNDLISNIYHVSAINDLTLCESDVLQVDVLDISENPVVGLEILADQISKTPPAIPTGELRGYASEQDGTTDTYDFSWYFENDSITAVYNVAEHILTQQPSGSFEVVARNSVTNCFNSASAYLEENISRPEMTVSSSPMTICSPADGTITVNSINIAGVKDSISNYRFFLYQNDPISANLITSSDGAVTDGHIFQNLNAGLYYLVAEEKSLSLSTVPEQIIVEDHSSYPLISLTYVKPQTSFNPDPNYHNGRLSISINGFTTISNFSIMWYTGQNISGNHLNSFNDSLTITGLTDGYYTVRVINQVTNCESIETFYVEEDRKPLFLVASTSPNTFCVNGNGRASALVKDNISTYDYLWYESGPVYPNGSPDYSGQVINNGLLGGTYIVVAIDQNDPFRYVIDTVELRDILKYPEVDVEEINPQRNCYVDQPTGQLLAKVTNDDISFYEMNWYQVPDTVTSIGNQAIITDLPVNTYVAKATNSITGCWEISDPAEISEDIAPVPSPDPVVLSHLTSCAMPNGVINASVNGDYANYNFNWYQGNTVTASSDFVGIKWENREIGTYAVTATDKITGCRSDSASFIHVEDKRVYPEFVTIVTNEKCGNADGSISIDIENEIALKEIVFNDGFESIYEPNLVNYPSGTYQVTVTTQLECSSTQDAEIGTDILIFNGISENGDGANDWFIIGCIEKFFNNHVKIFNRSGDLVFETTNYDNDINYFNGHGNRGLYLDNKELPIGTYFYMIDLKDSSEPFTGYLELVR